MNAIPGRPTLGRAISLIPHAATQRTADVQVMADVDTAADLRDAATRFHAALSQAEFNIAPPVDLTLATKAAAGLAAVDLNAYQRRIGDQVAGVAGRLASVSTDEPELMDGLLPSEMIDQPYDGPEHTSIHLIPYRDAFLLHARTGCVVGTPREQGTFPFSRDGLRRFRDLADRVLGDRT